ncbi:MULTISPECIES: glycoside hydrolase family 55 protein [unclassified Clostridioides]|uniref:glycoside hydrolase family 55 protein n=1 Tax=unclassified Clostridioides TaxID=2635829 RepID=UPI001D10633C|nr:glycoside hydrolase family 55 protein [Clostridioides sp. ZZV14-6150]MCC0718802.1 glycoside hydrolase family 55 protein [Clostridioides sp. ZZV14-6105]MCC0742757.1 glycoside hydrolase family 55 protein [Clostridioides sp. ZZV14-6044]MCC0751288.1 glycoside hydrolase family 55 protein [Clostridioides sp. ZZV13-5731]WLD29538.1 Pectate lyase superfamily protein [Clostridioides difficile]
MAIETKTPDWVNVLELNSKIDITGKSDVSDMIQDIVSDESLKDSVIYFPNGDYLFEKGIKISQQITLQGNSYYGGDVLELSESEDNKKPFIGATNFITRGVSNMSIVTLTETNQTIKNINFYYDNREIKNELPKDVSAITEGEGVQGLSHFEHLYISGFSGTGIEIPLYATGNDITVTSCGLGIKLGEKSMLSSSKIHKCKNGMEITTGVSLNNVKIEDIQEVGINNKGLGFNLMINLAVDKCGYCGFMFEKMSHSQITARFTNCSQYYKNVDYDTYKNLPDKKEGAYSILYGDTLDNCNIVLMNNNVDTLENGLERKIHVIKANETTNVTLECDAEADSFIQCAKGNLLLENGRNTYKFYDGEICSVGGVQVSDVNQGDLLKIIDNTLYVDDGGKDLVVPKLQKNSVISSILDSEVEISKLHSGTWEQIGVKTLNGEPMYYYKKIND